MKRIKPSPNKHHWPRKAVRSIECRPRDLVVRITDWTRDRYEPGYDVEVYIGGVYDYNESKVFGFSPDSKHGQNGPLLAHVLLLTKEQAKAAASYFASQQIAKLL